MLIFTSTLNTNTYTTTNNKKRTNSQTIVAKLYRLRCYHFGYRQLRSNDIRVKTLSCQQATAYRLPALFLCVNLFSVSLANCGKILDY